MGREPPRPVRLGLLRLTDAAPVFLVDAEGLFAAEGVAVLAGNARPMAQAAE